MKVAIFLSVLLASKAFAVEKCLEEYKNLETSLSANKSVQKELSKSSGSCLEDWSSSVDQFPSICGVGDVGAFRKRLYKDIDDRTASLSKANAKGDKITASSEAALAVYKNCMSKFESKSPCEEVTDKYVVCNGERFEKTKAVTESLKRNLKQIEQKDEKSTARSSGIRK